MGMLEQAIALATLVHAGQVDKAGEPYILHPQYVASLVQTEREKTVAYLHDVVEDTDVTLDELTTQFPPEIVEAVQLLTKQSGKSDQEYLQGIKANELARIVKLADLTHNQMMNRIPNPTEKDFARLKKYQLSYQFLQK